MASSVLELAVVERRHLVLFVIVLCFCWACWWHHGARSRRQSESQIWEYGVFPCGLSWLTLPTVLMSVSLFDLDRLSSTLNSFLGKMPLGLRPRNMTLPPLPCKLAPASLVTIPSSLSRSGSRMVSSRRRLPFETAADASGLSLFQVRWYVLSGLGVSLRDRPKMGPNNRRKGVRSMGRHAQTMPALASMTDQIVAGMGPQVGSGSLADAAIVVAR